jgi:hypothetical protein
MPGDVLGLTEVSYVDGDVRIVLREKTGERARLRRLHLGVVAVQVEVLRIGALPHPAHGAELAAPVADAHPLVAVGVVDRVDEQHHVLQPRGPLAPGDRPQQPQRGFLALDLAVAPGAPTTASGIGRPSKV